MEHLLKLTDYLRIVMKIFLFFIGIIISLWVFLSWCWNIITKIRFKKEWGVNSNKFFAKRCMDEGDRNNGRDHIYLVDDGNGKIRRVVNGYTLNELGYPRPPRVNENEKRNEKFYFEKKNYTLCNEIKIINIASIINTLKNIKN